MTASIWKRLERYGPVWLRASVNPGPLGPVVITTGPFFCEHHLREVSKRSACETFSSEGLEHESQKTKIKLIIPVFQDEERET